MAVAPTIAKQTRRKREGWGHGPASFSAVIDEEAAGKCLFGPSGVKTPEGNAAFLSCLIARPTKPLTISAICEAAEMAGGSCRESLSASAPASKLSVTATPSVRRSPRVGKKKKPAANVPTTAPAVLTQ